MIRHFTLYRPASPSHFVFAVSIVHLCVEGGWGCSQNIFFSWYTLWPSRLSSKKFKKNLSFSKMKIPILNPSKMCCKHLKTRECIGQNGICSVVSDYWYISDDESSGIKEKTQPLLLGTSLFNSLSVQFLTSWKQEEMDDRHQVQADFFLLLGVISFHILNLFIVLYLQQTCVPSNLNRK